MVVVVSSSVSLDFVFLSILCAKLLGSSFFITLASSVSLSNCWRMRENLHLISLTISPLRNGRGAGHG